MRSVVIYLLLLVIKTVSRIFYRREMEWVGDVPANPWEGHRIVALLHHTSLYEPLFAGFPPNGFLWRMATHGVVPAADKTIKRPLVGLLFKFVAHEVVSISRQRDHTWSEVLARIDPDSMIIILPEGRMMRANGLDSSGQPMTVRGGITDILEAAGKGRILLAYSGGLHHIQVPGEMFPRLFKKIRLRLEVVDIASYIESLAPEGGDALKRAVKEDLERRREIYCYD